MDFITLLLLSVGLAMDAFAVSISNGICFQKIGKKEVFLTAFMFGLFQGIMPVLGFFAGQTFSIYIEKIDHWIALALLSFIGGKMVYEAVKEMRNKEKAVCELFSFKLLFIQAIATSIDALAIGVSFAAMRVEIWSASGAIALITFICCIIGVLIGKKFGEILKQRAEIFGGSLLILLGAKIFFEHML